MIQSDVLRTDERTREPFTTGATMYRQMGMRFWQGQAEVEIQR
jgi:hypothetical protein